ncbi:MAG TPA: hypothetical protein PKM65_11095 [Spirochaetota bacterium]|nr:hypothetical protein [Spirochaetota bacterium]HNT09345.1 hypothetical protein [Spirochaetota bacterium]HNV48953.1 hypothetical protein [Spirochaetota bacterium]HOS39169.1 hypothetical protein [Spirochaetota bacterium]HPU87171.1 hypothetical protein [Spirochaetota bacterium]
MMDERWKNVFMVIGILAVVYVLFWHVLPAVLKAVGWLLGVLFQIAIWGAVIFGAVLLVAYIARMVKNRV